MAKNKSIYAVISLANHACSFSSARPRCEMAFFLALSISAYVSPSYSKMGSQPGAHNQFLNTLKQMKRGRRRRTKVTRPPRRHNLAIRDALEEDGLVSGPRRVRKGAHGLGGFVVVGGQEVVETVVADGFEKPFAGRGGIINIWHKQFCG